MSQSQYQKLIEELNSELDEQDQLTKAQSRDWDDDEDDDDEDRDGDGDGVDNEDEDASADAGSDSDSDSDNDDDEDEDDEDEDEDEEDEEKMGKSFSLTLDNGEEIEAVDGTEMIKALQQRIESTEKSMSEGMSKAVKLIKQQNEMMKSMQSDLEKLGKQRRGRRSVVNVHEKPDLEKSTKPDAGQQDTSPQELMTKALHAQSEGRISGTDVALAEAHINHGSQVPEKLRNRILNQQ